MLTEPEIVSEDMSEIVVRIASVLEYLDISSKATPISSVSLSREDISCNFESKPEACCPNTKSTFPLF